MSPGCRPPRRARISPIRPRLMRPPSRACAPPARSRSARPTSTSSRPAWSACARPTACRATRSTETHTRRLKLRLRRRGRGGAGAVLARHRHGRLGPRSGGARQHRRTEAKPRCGLDRGRRSRLPHARLRLGVRAHRRRCLDRIRRDGRARRRRSVLAQPAARHAGAAAARLAHRRADQGPARVLRRSGLGRRVRGRDRTLRRARRGDHGNRHRAVLRNCAAALRRPVGRGALSRHPQADRFVA